MKRLLGAFLGILTAIGGFVDIGDLVANSETGARFNMGLAWVVLVGIVGIIVYAEMAGRVAAVARRPVFDLVRERLGPGSQPSTWWRRSASTSSPSSPSWPASPSPSRSCRASTTCCSSRWPACWSGWSCGGCRSR